MNDIKYLIRSLIILVGIAVVPAFSANLKMSDANKMTFDFIKGHTLIVPHLNSDNTLKLRDSMQKLAQTGANYVCLAVMAEMDVFNKPHINWGSSYYNFTDEMLIQAIRIARDNQLKIILKPMVNCKDGTWRSWIEFIDNDGDQDLAAWGIWWKEYESFILHYAAIAQQTQCEMLCLGCEMGSTEGFEKKWRHLIGQTRKIYTGLLTYNTNHDHTQYVHFWDVLDVVSISAYYALGRYMEDAGIAHAMDPNKPVTADNVKTAWKQIRQKLRGIQANLEKPIFFIECGICSANNLSRTPWEHANTEMVYNGKEQAEFYQAVFETFWDEPWFMGFAWWDWPAALYPKQEAQNNVDFAIYGKPAEDVVKKWYRKQRECIIDIKKK